jgi:predicted ribosomally synthesized peptide with SipW-like signal peptide
MKKIIGLTIAAILIIGLVGVGTWAYFGDTEVSSGSLAAGTLDLQVGGGSEAVITAQQTRILSQAEWFRIDYTNKQRIG